MIVDMITVNVSCNHILKTIFQCLVCKFDSYFMSGLIVNFSRSK